MERKCNRLPLALWIDKVTFNDDDDDEKKT